MSFGLLTLGGVVGEEQEGDVVLLDHLDSFLGTRDGLFALDDDAIDVDD